MRKPEMSLDLPQPTVKKQLFSVLSCAWANSNYTANLKRDVPSHFNTSSKFGLGTRSDIQRSINWESLDTSAGEIALDNTWAAQKGLPASTSFWWDQSQRSIYLVNGHHNLHCLRKLRRSIVLSRYNMTQMDSYPHLVHCMDHLLQNILCDADDTPLYTVPKHNSSTGHGQPRQCRSWDKLQAWAESQTSCFSYINETQGVDAILQRFRYCPDSDPGHRYDAAMRAHFNLGPDWDGTPRRDIDTIPQYWKNFPE
ncbi:hypothetical protein FH972_023628 [Carpinus fangiana]|uniref:Uncharacterized protein n=1 Tax=Carpinus fangiana TaxID=176857 RepID=A0A5N6KVQ7_9ROSI|nr:hypothetical protein FH972_023628 [Carpinus fangiana]